MDENIENKEEEDFTSEQVDGKPIFCPLCGQSTYIPDSLIAEKSLICPSCNEEFANPVQSGKIKPVKPIREKKSSGDKGKNSFIWMVVALALILIGVWYFNSRVDTPNTQYSKPLVYDNSVYKYYDDRNEERDLLRQCMKLFQLHNEPASSSQSKKGYDANGKKSDVFTYRSNYNEISVPGLDGVKERGMIVFHTFDLSRMVITKTMIVNGSEVRTSYPIRSSTMQNISGYSVFKMVIKTSGVEEIGFSPAVGNIWYDYLDGKQIVYFKVKWM
jgi:hypothetical protein